MSTWLDNYQFRKEDDPPDPYAGRSVCVELDYILEDIGTRSWDLWGYPFADRGLGKLEHPTLPEWLASMGAPS